MGYAKHRGGRALKTKPSKLKFPSLPCTSKLPLWGSGNHPRLSRYFRKQWIFQAPWLSVLQLNNAAPLELLLEHCGFYGISLMLSVTEMDALCCSGVGEGPSSWFGRAGFGVSSAFTPLWPLAMSEVTEPLVTLCAGAVVGGFYSILSRCCLCLCFLVPILGCDSRVFYSSR